MAIETISKLCEIKSGEVGKNAESFFCDSKFLLRNLFKTPKLLPPLLFHSDKRNMVESSGAKSCLGQSRGEQVAATCVTPLKKGRGKREREREFCQLPAIYQDPSARAWFEDLGSVDPDSSILSRLQKPDSFTLSTISTRFWESLVHGETHRIADVPDLCH